MAAPKMVMAKPLMLMSPAPGRCQVCATKHEPKLPHNAQSIYYQMKFKMETGKEPSWKTAMAHCTARVKRLWTAQLKEMGVDVAAGRINPTKA